MWRIWCYALGKKEGRSKRDADNIAIIRTVILLSYLITNCFIIAGVVRHWNDAEVQNVSTMQSMQHRNQQQQ